MKRRHPFGARLRNWLIALHMAEHIEARWMAQGRMPNNEEYAAEMTNINKRLNPRYGWMGNDGKYHTLHGN